MKTIELILTNQCNNTCVFCHSPLAASASEMGMETCRKVLRWGRKAGASGVYFGGGEPTVFGNFMDIVTFAKAEGYERIRLLTNGMRLEDAAYVDALIGAGVNEFEISVKGHDAETHDELSRFPGTFSKLMHAVKHIARRDAGIIITVLITTRNYKYLPETVSMFAGMGVHQFSLWLVSLYDMDSEKLSCLLPSFTEIVPYVAESFSIAEQRSLHMETNHIPPCFLPERHRKNFLDVRDLDLLVVSKDGKFKLEESAYEGGVKAEECLRCRENERCPGLRADYVEAYGTGEIKAVESAGTPHKKQKVVI